MRITFGDVATGLENMLDLYFPIDRKKLFEQNGM